MWVLCQGCSNQSNAAQTPSEAASDRYHTSVMLPLEGQSPKVRGPLDLTWGKETFGIFTITCSVKLGHIHVMRVLGV